MRPSIVFALIVVCFTIVQGQLVIPQFNNADDLISLLPEFQEFVGQLEHVFPQLTTTLTSAEIESFKNKITQLMVNEIINQGTVSSLVNKLQPLFEQLLSPKKRDVLPQFSNLVSQLTSLLNQFNGLLSASQLQTLKDRLIQLIISQLASKADLATLTTQLRNLLEEYLGSNVQGRNNIDALIQQIISTTSSALPGMVIGMIGGK